jgi:hypothetical protein
MALITINELRIGFRGPLLLDHVSCQIEAGQRIECAAELERAHALEVLAFEEYFGAELFIQRARSHDGRAMGVAFDALCRGGHIVEGGECQHGLAHPVDCTDM